MLKPDWLFGWLYGTFIEFHNFGFLQISLLDIYGNFVCNSYLCDNVMENDNDYVLLIVYMGSFGPLESLIQFVSCDIFFIFDNLNGF